MEALYLKVKKDLLEKINNGIYPEGQTIPTEHELVEIYNVSRPTVRQAVQLLVDAGYLEKRKKRGTIVCAPKIEQEFTQFIASFDSEMNKKGLATSTQVLTLKKEVATKMVCEKLNLVKDSDVYKLVRLRFVDNKPNVLVTTYVPCDLFPTMGKVDFTENRLYHFFNDCNNPIHSIVRKLETIKADDTIADLLDVEEGDPLFYFKSIGYNESKKPIEYSISKYRGDNNSFTFELSNKK